MWLDQYCQLATISRLIERERKKDKKIWKIEWLCILRQINVLRINACLLVLRGGHEQTYPTSKHKIINWGSIVFTATLCWENYSHANLFFLKWLSIRHSLTSMTLCSKMHNMAKFYSKCLILCRKIWLTRSSFFF